MSLNESDLVRRLHSTETSFVERKRVSDTQDIAKTIVAFANTLRPDQEGVIFLGATDKGLIEDHGSDLDKLQRKFVDKTKNIYPECPYFEAHEVKEGDKACLAIVVPGGANRPYFAGPPYFRRASTSAKATREEFEQLLAARSSKAYELQQWIGKSITLHMVDGPPAHRVREVAVETCNHFYVTLFKDTWKVSYPLRMVELSFDHSQNRLELLMSLSFMGSPGRIGA